MQSKKSIITSGLGWGRLPLFQIEDELSSGNLIAMNLIGMIPDRDVTIYLARNKNIPMGSVSKKLWKQLTTANK